MGCVGGKNKVYVFEIQESKEGHGQDTYDMCTQCLKMDEAAINRFYKLFKKIDIKDTETIQIDEFYTYIKTERTKFADRCFYFLDDDRSNEIDFKEFVLALWIFLTVRNNNFVRFAFGLYDTDDTFRIKAEVLEDMFADVYGSHWKANAKVVEIVKKMQDETYDGALTLMKFEEHAKKYDKLLVPMFNMQLHLRERIFGKQFWGNEAEKRDRLYGDIAGNLKKHILKQVDQIQKGVGGQRTDEHADSTIKRDPNGGTEKIAVQKDEKKAKKKKKK